jgi:hypothetical protein
MHSINTTFIMNLCGIMQTNVSLWARVLEGKYVKSQDHLPKVQAKGKDSRLCKAIYDVWPSNCWWLKFTHKSFILDVGVATYPMTISQGLSSRNHSTLCLVFRLLVVSIHIIPLPIKPHITFMRVITGTWDPFKTR